MEITDLVSKRLYIKPTETGMFSNNQETGIHIQENNCVEIYAGATSIVVDGNSGTITLNSRKLNQVASQINLRSNPDGITFPYGKLNPALLPTYSESLVGSRANLEAVRSMLTPKSLGVLSNFGLLPKGATKDTPPVMLSSLFKLIVPIKTVSASSKMNAVYSELKKEIPNLEG